MKRLPPLRVETIEGFNVVRDDRVPGGTKQRVLERLLPEMGPGEYVFGSPAEGYAQVALSYACERLGLDDNAYRSTIFVAGRAKPHINTVKAEAAGASIHYVRPGYLSNVQAKAKAYSAKVGAHFFPLGFHGERFIAILAELARDLPLKDYPPREVWTVAGSGVLTRALQQAWPSAKFFAVQIGFPPDVGRATLLQAPEAFAQDAIYPPPFASCSNYDAKAWRFMVKQASPGALFWNVAS